MMVIRRAVCGTLIVAGALAILILGPRVQEWRYDLLLDRENLRQARAESGRPEMTLQEMRALREKSNALWETLDLPRKLRLLPAPCKPLPSRINPPR